MKDGKVIVTTNGAFDLLHVGHIRFLKQAKSYGDYLIVCLNSDASVREYKNKYRPIIPQEQRKEMLEAIRYVDEVRIFDETDPRRILGEIKPDVHVKTRESYKGLEGNIVEVNGGKLVLLDDIDKGSLSSSALLEKCYYYWELEKAVKDIYRDFPSIR